MKGGWALDPQNGMKSGSHVQTSLASAVFVKQERKIRLDNEWLPLGVMGVKNLLPYM